MKNIRLLTGLITVAVALTAGQAAPRDNIEREIQRLHAETGVRIHYLYDPTCYFPAEWRNDDIAPEAEPLPLDEVRYVLPVVRRFLSAYPVELLRQNLTAIYLASRFQFYGKNYGGTSFQSSIYLACPENAPDEFLLARLHSEFSSILLRKHAFPKEAWRQLLPPQFRYLGSGVAMLGQRNLYAQDSRLLADGFIVRYAQSSLENDFNMMADWLFTKPAKLDALCRKYPLLRQKRDLVVQFYQSIGCPIPATGREGTRPVLGWAGAPLVEPAS